MNQDRESFLRRSLGALSFVACLVWAGATFALEEEISLVREEVSIPPGETRGFEFGTVPQRDTTVLLQMLARLHFSTPSGSMYFLKMTLNGREVTAAPTRRATRLVNRPLVSPVAANLPAPWFGSGGWRLLYAPDFEVGRRQKFLVGDPYLLVLDVTDLVNPAAENRLQVTNTARPRPGGWKSPEGNLVLGRLTVRTRPGASPTMAGARNVAPIVNRGEPGAGPAAYRGEVLPGGGFRMATALQRWTFASDLSYPKAGLNRLVPGDVPDRQGQAGWEPRAERQPDGATVTARGPDYRLARRIRFTPRKVEIADTLTNAHADAPLGLMVRHEVSLAGLSDPPVRLAGNPDPAVNDYYSPPNPTVHIAAGTEGLGLLCEDDVFRNQARLFVTADPPAAGLRTEMLRLAPGESYTLRWSVYPVAGPDYFDFINLVRQDWGSNVTVDGAWTFFHPDTILASPIERLREQFERLGIRYACYCGGWVDYRHDRKRIGFGTGVLDDYWADFRRRLKEAAARLHQAVPGVKVLVYYDTQRDTSEGGQQRFRDSWLTDASGRQSTTEWGGVYSLTRSVVATPTNTFGKAMLTAADRYLDELGIDGLYWDEMEHVGYGFPLLTHNMADGHSCLLDPKTYAIQREVGVTTLLGEPHRLAVIDRVRRQGGVLMGNGPPFTRAILATGVPRMVEVQHNDYWCYEGNLGTPLGYMSSKTEFANVVRGLRQACLPVGTRCDYEHEISRYLFPFTPIELHAGYLLGKERIVAIHSGSYGWPGQRSLALVHHFDSRGKRGPGKAKTTVRGEARTAVQLADGEAVVLERLPLAIAPASGSVEVAGVEYSAQGIALRVTAASASVLQIREGPFAVDRGRGCAVQLDGKELPTRRENDGSFCVELPPTNSGLLRVRARTP